MGMCNDYGLWEYYTHTYEPAEKIPEDHPLDGLLSELGEVPGGYYAQNCENCGVQPYDVRIYGTYNYEDRECTQPVGDSALSYCEPCLVQQIIGTYRSQVWHDDVQICWYVAEAKPHPYV
jgi:hypothetical protein